MREMSTSASVFTARIGLGGHLFGLHGTRVQGFTGAILICNQGVRGSSPLRGTAKINHLRATTRNFRIVHMPIKSAARTRCTSVPRVPTAQHHLSAVPNRAASHPFLHCRRNEMETE